MASNNGWHWNLINYLIGPYIYSKFCFNLLCIESFMMVSLPQTLGGEKRGKKNETRKWREKWHIVPGDQGSEVYYWLNVLRKYHFNFFSSIFSIVDVDKLAMRIKGEVARKKDSLGIAQIWHPMSKWLELYSFRKP